MVTDGVCPTEGVVVRVVVVDVGGLVVGTDVVDGGQFIVVVGAPVVDVPEVLDTSVTTVVNGVIVG